MPLDFTRPLIHSEGFKVEFYGFLTDTGKFTSYEKGERVSFGHSEAAAELYEMGVRYLFHFEGSRNDYVFNFDVNGNCLPEPYNGEHFYDVTIFSGYGSIQNVPYPDKSDPANSIIMTDAYAPDVWGTF